MEHGSGIKIMRFSGFEWEGLGIKNPAKLDNLRGFGTAWDCLRQA